MFEDPLRVATARAILESLVVDAYLAIKVGLGAGDVQALVEKAFITAGIQKRTEEGASDPASTDGLAKITGLSRAAVNSLKSGDDVRPKPFQNPGVKVMSAWLSSDEYLEDGQPKIIPIRGKAPSFHALTIAAIGKDLRPSSVLKLLHERGVPRGPPG